MTSNLKQFTRACFECDTIDDLTAELKRGPRVDDIHLWHLTEAEWRTGIKRAIRMMKRERLWFRLMSYVGAYLPHVARDVTDTRETSLWLWWGRFGFAIPGTKRSNPSYRG